MTHSAVAVAIYVGLFVALAAVIYLFAYDRPRPASASWIFPLMVMTACAAAANSLHFPPRQMWALAGGLVFPAWGIIMARRGAKDPTLQGYRLAIPGGLVWGAYGALAKDSFVGGLAVGIWFTVALSYLMTRAQAGAGSAASPKTP